MNKQQFRAAFRMARLVRGFEREVRVPLKITQQLDPAALSATIRRHDYLSAGYAGTGHRCGRRKPRFISGPRGVLPA